MVIDHICTIAVLLKKFFAKRFKERRMREMKRMLAILLVLAMVVGMMPMAMAADTDDGIRQAVELPGVNRLDPSKTAGKDTGLHRYSDDEIVTVIVQLEEPSLLERGSSRSFSAIPDGTAGENVSAYLNGKEAQAASRAMLKQQNTVLAQMNRIQPSGSVKVVAQWTSVANAMAVRIPYGQIDSIRGLSHVKQVYVERVYDLPETMDMGQDQSSIYGYSYDMVSLSKAWDAGFTGKGMLVAVLDSGLDIYYDEATGTVTRAHEAFTEDSFRDKPAEDELRYTSESLAGLLESVQLNATTGANGEKITYENNGLYKNSKVPYAYDYAGVFDSWSGIVVGGDLNVIPVGSDHGTHVSGTVAGYAESAEGEILFTGIAPDAQLMMLKVFPDGGGGAPESTIITALEDAMLLGADVVNLSFGSDNGYDNDGSLQAEICAAMQEAGIILMTAAGNSDTSSYNNNHGGLNLATDPDNSIVAAPAVYHSNFAVASINNMVATQSVLDWTGSDGQPHTITYADPTVTALKLALAGREIELIPVPGTGTYDDFRSAGFDYYGYGKTGIALVRRGESTFTQKVQMAEYFSGTDWYTGQRTGVLAVLVYDSDPNGTELINMALEDVTMPAAFISGQDGAAILAALENGKVTVNVRQQDVMIPASDGGLMSSFSSWGAGPGLELKPEITAPGGNIWSAVTDPAYKDGEYTGSYSMMSGTSMAAPHMAGLAALVGQYAVENQLAGEKTDLSALVSSLLTSTALPHKDADGNYYSPRLQGAGLVNVGAAVSTPAYITVEDELVGKLELGDDPDWTGFYDLAFHIQNLTDETLTYQAKAVLLRPGCEDGLMQTNEVLIKEVDLGTVTVPAVGADFTGTISLTAEEAAAIKALFPNGTYIEGFVILTDAEGNAPQIGLPYLAFLGDWTAAPIFDSASWIDTPEDGQSVWNNPTTWGVFYANSALIIEDTILSYYTLGQNLFDAASSEQGVFHPENIFISPNGDGYMDEVNYFVLYQLRSAKLIVVEVTDKATGEFYFRDYSTYNQKTVYSLDYQQLVLSSLISFTQENWGGKDLEGNLLPDGTQCVFTITAYGEGEYAEIYDEATDSYVPDFGSVVPGETEPAFNGHAMDKTGDVFTFDVTVDTEAPELENHAVRIYEEGGRTYLTGTFHDDGALASIEVIPLINIYDSWYETSFLSEDFDNPFYVEQIYDPATKTVTFTADITEYQHINGSLDYGQTASWTGIVYVYGGDYAANDRGYMVIVDPTEGLILSRTSALMYPGESFFLSVNNNTGSDAPLTRTSSNPEVAVIDELGTITAIAPGQTVISVSNGVETAVCIVAVENPDTQLTDFRLSLENFSGMKPGSTIAAEIVDVQPAGISLLDVDITCTVYADDPAYDDLLGCFLTDDSEAVGVYLQYPSGTEGLPRDGHAGTLEVTIGDITRTMTFDWEDLYEEGNQDDLVPYYEECDQVIFMNYGETANLIARYNNKSAHEFAFVALYTAEGYVDYGANNSQEAPAGLVLEGPPTAPLGGQWTGRLVNTAGYALPESIRVFQGYYSSYDGTYYESEKTNSQWTTQFEYDPTTGEITVYYAPYSNGYYLVIRADGVEDEGNPGGTLSDTEYAVPDGRYGPFNWTITEGSGTLTPADNVRLDYETVNLAYYTPDAPGISYITAASKDGKYSLNFAVVCYPVRASLLEVETHDVVMEIGDSRKLTANLTPEPTLAEDAELLLTSFNEDVVTVAEDGTLTAVKSGYAYIKVSTKADSTVWDYCVVHVAPCKHNGETELRGVKEPDCTEEGHTGYVVCLICDEVIESGAVLPALGHSPTLINFALPTANTVGYSGDWVCTRCGELLEKGTILFPLNGGSGEGGFTPGGSSAPGCSCGKFTDLLQNVWYHDAVEYVLANGIMNGTGDGTTFSPNMPLSRAMMMTMLARLDGVNTDGGATWYAKGMAWAVANGISDGTNPDGNITREQLVTMLYRYAGSPEVGYDVLSIYFDADQVSDWARDAVNWAVANGVMNGKGNGTLDPQGLTTRVEAAQFFMNFANAK